MYLYICAHASVCVYVCILKLSTEPVEKRSALLLLNHWRQQLWISFFWISLKQIPAAPWLGGKESTCQRRRRGFDPGSGRFSAEGNGNPLQYSCPGSPKDRGAWWATVHRVVKSQTRLTTKHQPRSRPHACPREPTAASHSVPSGASATMGHELRDFSRTKHYTPPERESKCCLCERHI